MAVTNPVLSVRASPTSLKARRSDDVGVALQVHPHAVPSLVILLEAKSALFEVKTHPRRTSSPSDQPRTLAPTATTPSPEELFALVTTLRAEVQELRNSQNGNGGSHGNGRGGGGGGGGGADDDNHNNTPHTTRTPTHASDSFDDGGAKTEEEDHPFSDAIMAYQMPSNLTLPTTLKSYDGIRDPKVHVTKFKSAMLLNSASGPILCCAFPNFLDGAALIWFSSLPAGSVSSSSQLSGLFKNHFYNTLDLSTS
ncbi:hypothetical protein PIB30_073614 [Stylosanthes scabra]|uniref:Retrotransposon gag domain-containing protein n=1 Tax=Stylosanthes scabra TaxID=79078 RepID=A0ABU6RPW9_9FABA|nr:hypothetical protein [Stylosanthes scabra]